MKNLFNNLYFFVLFLCFNAVGYAQLYPVQLTPVFNSPYSVKISDYATSMDTKMQLLINPTDISISQRRVRLKLYIQGNGLNIQTSDYAQEQRPIYINGGELQTLTNVDIASLFRLENLQGISAAQYANPLPEGMYNFCFEMYDFVTNQKISQKSCASLYLILNDPPLLNTPQKNEQIASTEFPNILFTWTPRQINATNVSYKFELKQLLDPTLDPQIGFQMSPTLYEETLFGTAVLYNLSMPILTPGLRYAWRVRAVSTTGLSENAVFKNDGYSEIYSFKYTASCTAPTFLLSESQSSKSVKITWEGVPEHTRYQVQYKKQGVRNAQWFSSNSLNKQSLITNLEPGVTYEFRVGSSCDPAEDGVQSFTYSNISTFTTPTESNGVPAYNCGIVPQINIQNQKPLTNLIQSETFRAGDFPVTILELRGENSPYSGLGYIIVPYLADTKIAVEFKDIVINTDYQLISGVVETSYNPDWKNVTDIEDFTGEGKGGQIEEKVPFVIKDIIINANGDILVNGVDGEQITIPGGKDTVITDSGVVDKDGKVVVPPKVYTVDSEGNGSNQGVAVAEGGKPSPENTDGVDKSGQATAFTAKGISIAFSNNEDTNNGAKTKYAFDVISEGAPTALKKLYKQVDNVALPYKAVLNGDSDTMLATVTLTDAKINLDSIVFKTQNGAKIDFKRKDKVFVLTVNGSLSYAEEQVLATIKQGNKWQVIGAFMLVHISPKEVNLVLVPLNNNTQIPSDAEKSLTSIYSKLGIKLNITRSSKVDYTDEDKKIEVGDNDFFETYTSEQESINNSVKKLTDYKDNAYYLIYSDLPSNKPNIQGFMPLKGQFGFVFNTDNVAISGHELGHGIFGLEHPFTNKSDERKTNFLMDYNDGQEIWHNDWKQINDPAFKLYLFQGDNEGEYETDGHYSTVYLVSLMLGMDPKIAIKLAEAAEDPDTDINNSTYQFIVDDTWKNPSDQINIHSLTGGFHSTEEMLTAVDFMTTDVKKIKVLGEKLHRFGDTYAHTKLSSVNPSKLDDIELGDITDPKSEEVSKVIREWKNISGKPIADKIDPWIRYINKCVKVYGNGFFYNTALQKRLIANEKNNPISYPQLLKYLYEKNITPEGKFQMYGDRNLLFMTTEHGSTDGLWPDKIFVRPEWYLSYVKNLTVLIKLKFGLTKNIDFKIFNQMTDFVVKNKKSMKGVIDFEIARFYNKNYVKIPIFKTSVEHGAAYVLFDDEDLLKETITAKDMAILYAKTYYKKEVKLIEKTKNFYKITFK